MATPIQPSLAQMLQPTSQAARPAAPQAARAPQASAQNPTQATAQAGGFANALAAQKAFFQQITAPKVTPATYTAADIDRATQARTTLAAPTAVDETQPPKRPGSYLNIVI